VSDYIIKSALKKYLRDYKWEFALGSDFSKAIEMVDVQPTLDETEIIRKAFERVVERLKQQEEQYKARSQKCKELNYPQGADKHYGKACSYNHAIEIVKEEGGIE
jgi:hypothetical protein